MTANILIPANHPATIPAPYGTVPAMRLWMLSRPEERVGYEETRQVIVRARTAGDAVQFAMRTNTDEKAGEWYFATVTVVGFAPDQTGMEERPGIVMSDVSSA